MVSKKSPGQVLAAMLADNLSDYQMGPVVGDHVRQTIWGVNPEGSFVDGMTIDGFITQASQILKDSGRFYRFGNTIVYETDEPDNQQLSTVAVNHRAEPNAAAILANRLGVAFETKQGDVVRSLAATKLVSALLADEFLWPNLPKIRYHARRPTFDNDFGLCKPGWNASVGILVHAPDVIPTAQTPAYAQDAKAIDRLPPITTGLLREFNWRSDADLVNALSMLLTGLLINHLVDDPHPGGIVDANQAGTGKTLLVQTLGRVLDGIEPPRVSLTRDDELEKRLCAQVRSSRTSLFFMDNVRSRIESAVIEQNMLSPLLSFRILGKSATIERTNTYLWMITSNMTAGTPDFIRRCVPIRQFFEGDPKIRTFSGDPLEYAARHRLEVLGELAGMILNWVHEGMPLGCQRHRCKRWAAVIGGILNVAGVGEFFLGNLEEAEAQMDQGLIDLATLAEHAVNKGLDDLYGPVGCDNGGKGRASGQWVPVVAETQVLRDRFADASSKGKATAVGMFLSGKVNRTVSIDTAAGPRTATLRRREAAANQKLYYFEIANTEVNSDPAADPPTEAVAVGVAASNDDGPNSVALASLAGKTGAGPTATSPSAAKTTASADSNGSPNEADLEWV